MKLQIKLKNQERPRLKQKVKQYIQPLNRELSDGHSGGDRLTENYGYYIEYHPKPIKGDWNGSGMHANFSDTTLRTCGDEKTFNKVCEEFGKNIEKHISVYGAHNEQRLTGAHETQSITQFSYGVSDRGASIRIPIGTVEDGWKGRLEDRRPASNGDPYKIASVIISTTKSAY